MIDIATLHLPENDGEVFCAPPFGEYAGLIDKNRGLLSAEKMAYREELLALAHKKTVALGLDPGPAPAGPVIAAGHQPIPFHPGVAIKSVALAKMAEKVGGTALFITVDSDAVNHHNFWAPGVAEGLYCRHENSLLGMEGPLFEAATPTHSSQQVVDGLRQIADGIDHPLLAETHLALSRYLTRLQSRPLPDDNGVSRAIVMRRLWEAPVADRFLELPVSIACQSRAFRVFCQHIFENSADFSNSYNTELNRYRVERKLRYKANPFPDLRREEGWIETPFWGLQGEERLPLWVREGDWSRLRMGDERGEKGFEDLFETGNVAIRPKAIALSLFLRLHLSDFFIHGVGGAKYDNVTDGIITHFYGQAPPSYGCVTATLWPGGADPDWDPVGERNKIQETIRIMEQKPELLADLADLDITALMEEKKGLVAAMKIAEADKRRLGARIGELNREMGEAFASARANLRDDLARLDREVAACEAARSRDYPYFFFDPERVAALLAGV